VREFIFIKTTKGSKSLLQVANTYGKHKTKSITVRTIHKIKKEKKTLRPHEQECVLYFGIRCKPPVKRRGIISYRVEMPETINEVFFTEMLIK